MSNPKTNRVMLGRKFVNVRDKVAFEKYKEVLHPPEPKKKISKTISSNKQNTYSFSDETLKIVSRLSTVNKLTDRKIEENEKGNTPNPTTTSLDKGYISDNKNKKVPFPKYAEEVDSKKPKGKGYDTVPFTQKSRESLNIFSTSPVVEIQKGYGVDEDVNSKASNALSSISIKSGDMSKTNSNKNYGDGEVFTKTTSKGDAFDTLFSNKESGENTSNIDSKVSAVGYQKHYEANDEVHNNMLNYTGVNSIKGCTKESHFRYSANEEKIEGNVQNFPKSFSAGSLNEISDGNNDSSGLHPKLLSPLSRVESRKQFEAAEKELVNSISTNQKGWSDAKIEKVNNPNAQIFPHSLLSDNWDDSSLHLHSLPTARRSFLPNMARSKSNPNKKLSHVNDDDYNSMQVIHPRDGHPDMLECLWLCEKCNKYRVIDFWDCVMHECLYCPLR